MNRLSLYRPLPSGLTLGQFLEQWLRDYAATNMRPRTYEGYALIIHTHLIPALGAILLPSLEPRHLQAYYAAKLASGRLDGKGPVTANTVHHHHRVIFEALEHAVKWGLVARNVARAVDPPRPKRVEMRTLSPNEVARFLDAAKGSPYYSALHLAVYTGLRRSELLALRWGRVSLELATLSVVETLHQLRGGEMVFQEPKSHKTRRPVALPPSAALVLQEHRVKQEAERALLGIKLSPDDLVFSWPDGSPFRPGNLTHAFKRIARRVGLSGVRLHDLRHTHATLMLMQGIHPKIVSERLGHSSVGITLDTYSHVVPGLQEAAALRFEEGLKEMLTPLTSVST